MGKLSDEMRAIGVPMICGDRCSGHNVTKHLRLPFVNTIALPNLLLNEYECAACGFVQNVGYDARDRMCFSRGNPHARTHNEWVIACGKWEHDFVLADADRRLWRFGFWCMWVVGAILYFAK